MINMKIVVLVFLCAVGAPAYADGKLQLRPGMMGVADIGAESCATFNDMHYNGPSGMEHHVLTWVQGYVYAQTGSNIDAMLAVMPENNGWDFDSLTGVFVDYCQANPEAKVAEAAVSLWKMLSDGARAPQQ